MKKKTSFITNDYPSKGRPVYVFVEQLVNAIVDQGIEVAVVAPQSLTKAILRHLPILPSKEVYQTPKGNKYVVYRPYTISFGNGKKSLYKIADYFNHKTIGNIIKKLSPDIIYAHFWENVIRVLPIVEKYGYPVFVACGEGDNAIEDMVGAMNDRQKRKLKMAVSGVISVSSENKRKCIEYGIAGESNVIVLPNAVDDLLFYPRGKNLALRRDFGVKDDDFLILYIGVFTPRKGALRLAKAIDQLNDEKIKVMFVGTSMPGVDDDPQCSGIVYKGPVKHNDLPAYFASADVFVLPTLKEGCSNAIVESLAMGLPVISSDGPFNDDILNEKNSIRINPMDVEAIKNAICELKNNKELYIDLTNNLRKEGSNYSINTRAQKIISFIESKISDKGGN